MSNRKRQAQRVTVRYKGPMLVSALDIYPSVHPDEWIVMSYGHPLKTSYDQRGVIQDDGITAGGFPSVEAAKAWIAMAFGPLTDERAWDEPEPFFGTTSVQRSQPIVHGPLCYCCLCLPFPKTDPCGFCGGEGCVLCKTEEMVKGGTE